MTKDDYAEYLRSPRWVQISRAMREAYPACQLCKFPHELNVHHLTYKRLGAESIPDDLIVLCRSCHAREHFLEDLEKFPHAYGGNPEKIKERIAKQTADALKKNMGRALELEEKEDKEDADSY